MKAALIVVCGIVFLALCVVVIGALLPKQHVASRRASYRATPEQLYGLIAGPQGWRSDVLRCESVPDSTGRELLAETTRDGQTITYELLDRVPPTSIKRRIATENLPYSGTWTISLQPEGGITIVRITENGQVYNPVFRFVSRFILGHTSTIDAYLNDLSKATGQKTTVVE